MSRDNDAYRNVTAVLRQQNPDRQVTFQNAHRVRKLTLISEIEQSLGRGMTETVPVAPGD